MCERQSGLPAWPFPLRMMVLWWTQHWGFQRAFSMSLCLQLSAFPCPAWPSWEINLTWKTVGWEPPWPPGPLLSPKGGISSAQDSPEHKPSGPKWFVDRGNPGRAGDLRQDPCIVQAWQLNNTLAFCWHPSQGDFFPPSEFMAQPEAVIPCQHFNKAFL